MRFFLYCGFPQYPNTNGTKILFENAATLVPAIPEIFASDVTVGGPLKIILLKPVDPDFDFMTLLDKPGSVYQLKIVKVKEGKMEEFEAMLNAIIDANRSNKNIGKMYKFDVDQ